MNLIGLEIADDIQDSKEVENFVKFLNSQHQLQQLKIFMDNFALWDPIVKMTNLEILYLRIGYRNSNEQLLAIQYNRVNTSVKFLKLKFGFSNLDFEIYQSVVNSLTGLVHLELR